MVIGPSAEFPSVVREDGLDRHALGFEERQYIFIEHMHRSHRQLRSVEPSPGIAAEAIEHRLQIDLAHALQGTHEEGVHRDKLAGVLDLDVALPELGAEALEQAYLLLSEGELVLAHRTLQTQQPLVLGEQPVTTPYPAHAAGADLHALQGQFLSYPQAALRRKG